MQLSRYLLATPLILALWATPLGVRAADPAGIALPQGQRVLDLAWADNANLTLLVDTGAAYELKRLELSRAALSAVEVPRTFAELRGDVRDGWSIELTLAPSGNAVAALARAKSPLEASRLYVLSIERDKAQAVSTRNIPADFWPDLLAWDARGQNLYIACQPYLNPDQAYSIGRLSLASGGFSGQVPRGNIDLVSQLACIAGRDALAVRCAGYRGEYPAEPLIALIDLKNSQTAILHSRAASLTLNSLSDGQLLVYSGGGKVQNAGPGKADAAPAEGLGSSGQWVLEQGGNELRSAKLALLASAGTLATTPDGRWLGFLATGRDLGSGDAERQYLGLQLVSSGKTLAGSVPCARFTFSPNGTMVCAVDEEGNRVYFFNLPAG